MTSKHLQTCFQKFPLAVVSTAQRFIQVFDINLLLNAVNSGAAVNANAYTRNIDSPLKYQVHEPQYHSYVLIEPYTSMYFELTFTSIYHHQHRCVAIFSEKKQQVPGGALSVGNPNGERTATVLRHRCTIIGVHT